MAHLVDWPGRHPLLMYSCPLAMECRLRAWHSRCVLAAMAPGVRAIASTNRGAPLARNVCRRHATACSVTHPEMHDNDHHNEYVTAVQDAALAGWSE